jgi:hypothetical protein
MNNFNYVESARMRDIYVGEEFMSKEEDFEDDEDFMAED